MLASAFSSVGGSTEGQGSISNAGAKVVIKIDTAKFFLYFLRQQSAFL